MPAQTLTKSTRPYGRVIDIFAGLDKNSDGALTYDEMYELFLDLGWKHEPWKMRELFHAIDTNGDNVNDIKEFLRWIFGESAEMGQELLGVTAECKIVMVRFHKQLEINGQSLADVFDEFAGDSGYLHKDQIFEMFKRNGDYSESILNGIFELFDWNQDTMIDETEFLDTFNKHIRDAKKVAKQERCQYTLLYNPDSDAAHDVQETLSRQQRQA